MRLEAHLSKRAEESATLASPVAKDTHTVRQHKLETGASSAVQCAVAVERTFPQGRCALAFKHSSLAMTSSPAAKFIHLSLQAQDTPRADLGRGWRGVIGDRSGTWIAQSVPHNARVRQWAGAVPESHRCADLRTNLERERAHRRPWTVGRRTVGFRNCRLVNQLVNQPFRAKPSTVARHL